jgi:hypothetical protein
VRNQAAFLRALGLGGGDPSDLRERIGAEHRLPADIRRDLRGETEAEIQQSAAALASLMPEDLLAPAEQPDFDGGARERVPDPVDPVQGHNDLIMSALNGLGPAGGDQDW